VRFDDFDRRVRFHVYDATMRSGAPPLCRRHSSWRRRATRPYGNCIWEALGMAAMLRADAKIVTSCGDCGTAAEVLVEDGAVRGEGLMNFALPARDWWNDIVFT